MKTSNKAFTVVLRVDTYKKLAEMAKKELRPLAQMARVILERAVKGNK